jgi:hypothetical protein
MSKHEKKDQTVVRLTTTGWSDSRGAHYKKSLTVLKRKSFGMNIIEEECSAVGAEEGLENIQNLLDVPDGIYEVVVCNISRDIESGYVDDWELRLVPFDA